MGTKYEGVPNFAATKEHYQALALVACLRELEQAQRDCDKASYLCQGDDYERVHAAYFEARDKTRQAVMELGIDPNKLGEVF